MPEGDTAWLVSSRLHEALVDQTISRCDLRVPSAAQASLIGATVVGVSPRGKHILLRARFPTPRTGPGAISPTQDWTLHSHLRMDGEWHLYRDGSKWRGGPGHWIRAVVGSPTWTAVGYRLGMLDLLPTAAEDRVVGHLGPDPLGEHYDAIAARRNLITDPQRPVGEALLDQRNVAGFGTNFVSEACFVAGFSPLTPVADGVAEQVLGVAERMIRANRGRAIRVTTGRARPGEAAWVHGRRTCLRCGSVLAHAEVGMPPTQRSIAWCPRCQD